MRRIALALLCCSAVSCGFSHINRDNAARPERAVGTAARVYMPGEAPPSNANPPETREEDMLMVGGAKAESDQSERIRDVPLGPLAVLFGYPFWIFGKTVSQKADKAVDQRNEQAEKDQAKESAAAPSRADAAERARLDAENAKLREQLDRGNSGTPSSAPSSTRAAVQAPQTAAQSSATPAGGDLRAELAALERTLAARDRRPAEGTASAPAPQVAGAAPTAVQPTSSAVASTGADAGLQREIIDENRDGRAERIVYYDVAHRIVRAEEDKDGNGTLETVAQYDESGQIAREFADQNGDGRPDRWSFYRNGAPQRVETDRNGDGFRDLVSVYADGQLLREEEDRNGDGQPDHITLYSSGEKTEDQEDIDFDGTLDVTSIYENGRLARRELRSQKLLERWQQSAP